MITLLHPLPAPANTPESGISGIIRTKRSADLIGLRQKDAFARRALLQEDLTGSV